MGSRLAGLCRSGKDDALAIEALLAAIPRYAAVTALAGDDLPTVADATAIEIVEDVEGGGGTDFGVPSEITAADRVPTTAAEAERLAGLVEAAWTVFDRVAAAAPAELRKGPRGGGRDTAKIVEHVDGADQAYAQVMGIKTAAPDRARSETVTALRDSMLEVLRRASDGSPIAERKWPPRYAYRRIAWHALDHAWEIEDRTEPDA